MSYLVLQVLVYTETDMDQMKQAMLLECQAMKMLMEKQKSTEMDKLRLEIKEKEGIIEEKDKTLEAEHKKLKEMT